MRKTILPLCFSICCLALFITKSHAQSFQTWSLTAPSFKTSNDNVLDSKSFNLQMTNLDQLEEGADLQIDIQFLTGLERNQLGELQKPSGYFYRVLTTAPIFQATVITASNEQLFQKTYGGNSVEREFGKNQAWSKEELAGNWNDRRSQFYQRLELMSLDVKSLETDLNQVLGGKVVTSSIPSLTNHSSESSTVSEPASPIIENTPSREEEESFSSNKEIEDTPTVQDRASDAPIENTKNTNSVNEIEEDTPTVQDRASDELIEDTKNTNSINEEQEEDYSPAIEDYSSRCIIPPNEYQYGKHRGGITIGGGILPLEVSNGSISTFVRDESPSGDTFSATVDIQDQKQAAFFRIGLSGENIAKHRAWNINFDFGFGKEEVSKFEASFDYGFLIGKDRIRFAPQLSLIGGASNIYLGEMHQNDLFIDIGDTRFYSETVDLKYKNTFVGGGPKLQVAISLAKNLDLKLHGSYVYGFSLGEKIKFTGSDKEDDSATEIRKLPHALVHYNINNSDDVNVDRLFNFTGIKFGASLCF